MVIKSIDQFQRNAAKVAGFTFIFAIVLVVFTNYSVTFRFIVPDAAETARNLMDHQTLFRINVACNLIYLVTLIVMSTSLYVILKPVNKNLALAAVFFRLLYALMWGLMAINTFYAIRLLGDANYLQVFEAAQLQTLSKLYLSSSRDAYYVGLPFWGLASMVCSYLLFKSRYIPKVLAAYGMISSAWCVFCAFAFIVSPHFGKIIDLGLFDVPLVIFEIIAGVWFLVKNLPSFDGAESQNGNT